MVRGGIQRNERRWVMPVEVAQMEDMTSKEYDVFFSYETSTSSELVRKLAEVLEGHGLK